MTLLSTKCMCNDITLCDNDKPMDTLTISMQMLANKISVYSVQLYKANALWHQYAQRCDMNVHISKTCAKRHACTMNCTFVGSSTFMICQYSGNLHICTAAICDRLRIGAYNRVCTLSGKTYQLSLSTDREKSSQNFPIFLQDDLNTSTGYMPSLASSAESSMAQQPTCECNNSRKSPTRKSSNSHTQTKVCTYSNDTHGTNMLRAMLTRMQLTHGTRKNHVLSSMPPAPISPLSCVGNYEHRMHVRSTSLSPHSTSRLCATFSPPTTPKSDVYRTQQKRPRSVSEGVTSRDRRMKARRRLAVCCKAYTHHSSTGLSMSEACASPTALHNSCTHRADVPHIDTLCSKPMLCHRSNGSGLIFSGTESSSTLCVNSAAVYPSTVRTTSHTPTSTHMDDGDVIRMSLSSDSAGYDESVQCSTKTITNTNYGNSAPILTFNRLPYQHAGHNELKNTSVNMIVSLSTNPALHTDTAIVVDTNIDCTRVQQSAQVPEVLTRSTHYLNPVHTSLVTCDIVAPQSRRVLPVDTHNKCEDNRRPRRRWVRKGRISLSLPAMVEHTVFKSSMSVPNTMMLCESARQTLYSLTLIRFKGNAHHATDVVSEMDLQVNMCVKVWQDITFFCVDMDEYHRGILFEDICVVLLYEMVTGKAITIFADNELHQTTRIELLPATPALCGILPAWDELCKARAWKKNAHKDTRRLLGLFLYKCMCARDERMSLIDRI
jgi:hypothetical protein